ncbi:hypothetical protein GM418_19285 [Maribellus comscasis]|uniref:Carbohydrate-binding domain-containing protein n=1 Tax=Maribellus comscasis TaxID=2681766 RepID=A0A6I6JRX3_9BACT|nr:carbohydrate-binding family 9-like protein [Maribellus comscasis]QGY45736.1 hypothetical protein GM418_19285 [Maribellus comscasis]
MELEQNIKIGLLKKGSLFFWLTFFLLKISFAQEIDFGKYASLLTPVSTYTIYKTDSKITIDGIAKETDWSKTERLSDFGDIRGNEWPEPFLQTDVKLLWDNENIYVFAKLEEPNLQGEMTKRDELLFNENVFEIFIDPDCDTHNYFEYEVNVLNTLFDLFLTRSYRDGGMALFTWDSPGFQSAVKTKGTINNSTDKDKSWTVEMKIPFADLRSADAVKIPQDKEIWKVNLMRVEWEGRNAADQKEYPDRVKTNYWTWSPQGLISMHYPERWGLVQFSEMKAAEGNVDFEVPVSEKLKKYLWWFFYKQKDYKKKVGKYAASLEEISVPEQIATEVSDGSKTSIQMWATPTQFTVELKHGDEILSLNETAKLKQRKNQK